MWFSARLLFKSEVSDGDDAPPLCEEKIKLVQADSEGDAHQKALAIGENEQIEYANSDGATICWKFIDLLEIQDVCESDLYDGVEVHSRLFWKDEG